MKKVIDYLKNENSSIIGECNKILNYLDGLKKSYKRATYRRPKLTIQQMVAQSYWFDAKELVVFTIYHLRKLEQLMEMYTDDDDEEIKILDFEFHDAWEFKQILQLLVVLFGL